MGMILIVLSFSTKKYFFNFLKNAEESRIRFKISRNKVFSSLMNSYLYGHYKEPVRKDGTSSIKYGVPISTDT